MGTTGKSEKQQPSRALTKQSGPGSIGALATLGPFGMLRRLFEDLDRTTAQPFSPTVEVTHRDGKLFVNADLPGMSAEDVQLSIEDDALIIAGERRSEHEERDGDVLRTERSYGSFQRVIPLPPGVDASAVDARFENGVLEVSLPLPAKKERGRQIEIQTGGSPKKIKPTESH
jgi:HSP20 family protein